MVVEEEEEEAETPYASRSDPYGRPPPDYYHHMRDPVSDKSSSGGYGYHGDDDLVSYPSLRGGSGASNGYGKLTVMEIHEDLHHHQK